MAWWVIGSGVLCAAMFALGLNVYEQVGSLVGGVADLVAIASGIVCVGLLDGT
jgi:hypothetical protein